MLEQEQIQRITIHGL